MNVTQGLDLRYPCVITAVGGGGKTSLLFALAREAAGQNRSVLITTTTAMFNPERVDGEKAQGQCADRLVLGSPEKLMLAPPNPGEIVLAASQLAAQGQKLKGYDPEALAPALSGVVADLILIEGDGARMKPVKAPADHEPVIPPLTKIVAGCIGLDCLGKPIDATHVHRPEYLAAVTGQPGGSPVSARTLTALIRHPQGLFKGTPPGAEKLLVLNKADTPDRQTRALKIIEALYHGPGQNFLSHRILPDKILPDRILVASLAHRTDPVRLVKN